MSTMKALKVRTGGLSATSKMPGYSWGLPVRSCQTGQALMKIEGSVCHKCYAKKGNYAYSNVKQVYEDRLRLFESETWVDDMVELIQKRAVDVPYFRWFDSGDLQSPAMLDKIIEVVKRTEGVRHWMPTREVKHIDRNIFLPSNLVVRVSAPMIGAKRVPGYRNTSTVAPRSMRKQWPELALERTTRNWYCPATLQGHECGECRACWNPMIENVVYLEH